MKGGLVLPYLLLLSCGGVVGPDPQLNTFESTVPPGTYSGNFQIIERRFVDGALADENNATIIESLVVDSRGIPQLGGTESLQLGQSYVISESYFKGTSTPTSLEINGTALVLQSQITFTDAAGAIWSGTDVLTILPQPLDTLHVTRRLAASSGAELAVVLITADLLKSYSN